MKSSTRSRASWPARGPGALRWAAIVKEAGSPSVSQAWEWYPDLQALLDECYSRTAQGIEESLLVGETAPGKALEKLAAFLVAALDIRRERGSFLSFRVSDDLPERQRRRLRERELMLLTRLKRHADEGPAGWIAGAAPCGFGLRHDFRLPGSSGHGR